MAVALGARAAKVRSRPIFDDDAGSPSIDPWATEFADVDVSRTGDCPEIDCVRALLPDDVIEDAEHRAAALGVGADRVLIASGALSEDSYLAALGERLGVAFEPLDGTQRACCPLDDERLIESAAAGMLPLAIDGELFLVVAPRGGAARRILRLIEESPVRGRRFRFTSAAGELKTKWPLLSAAPPRWRTNIVPVAIVLLLALAAAAVAPASTLLTAELSLAAVFLAWVGLRLAGALVKWLIAGRAPALPDDLLPVYTVIAALYREAASVDGLLRAIERLDYPGIMAQAPQDLNPCRP